MVQEFLQEAVNCPTMVEYKVRATTIICSALYSMFTLHAFTVFNPALQNRFCGIAIAAMPLLRYFCFILSIVYKHKCPQIAQ